MIEFFDRIVLINLKRRPDRLANFRKLQSECGWPLPEVEIFPAVDGERVGCAMGFTEGHGAFACRQSHVHVLERAASDGVKNILVLEDDCTFEADAFDRLDAFLKLVPQDYAQLMLGGQSSDQRLVTLVTPGLYRTKNTQRTHAYCMNGNKIPSLLKIWWTCTGHIDHILPQFQIGNNVYQPGVFIFGQSGGKSDISGATNPPKYWLTPESPKKHPSHTHILLLRAPRDVVDNLPGFFRGNWLDANGYDMGQKEAAAAADPKPHLAKWISVVGPQAASMACVPLAWHPDLKALDVRLATGRQVIEITASTVVEVQEKWKAAYV